MAVSRRTSQLYTGKVGQTVTYQLNGQWVQRTIGVTDKAPSILQLESRQRMKMINELLNPVKEFIFVGFPRLKKTRIHNAHNLASSHNRLNAIEGAYPDLKINYAKVLFSKGTMPNVGGITIVETAEGLEFSWEAAEDSKSVRWNDQVMLMAYMPEEKDAIFLMSAGKRNDGKAFLKIPRYAQPVIIETYLAFVSANHKLVSDSVYTGIRIWGKANY